jgi:adenylate cyclase
LQKPVLDAQQQNGGRQSLKRKLTSVFCADAQNYSRMMARDEAATLERLNRYREIMDRLFVRHDGRKVNTWGDAIIAEFSSVVEAVRCAVEIQDAIGSENRDLPENRQMWFRIGINLGDVMEENGDIYGDGVNIASRLESLAEPGGVMVSESVYKFTHKQLAIGFDYAGAKMVKGDDTPIIGYRVRTRGENSPQPEFGAAQTNAKETENTTSTPPQTPRSIEVALTKLQVFRDWFDGQEKKVKVAVVMIGFFFCINFFFSGISQPWFIFPSLPFALYILLRRRKQRSG